MRFDLAIQALHDQGVEFVVIGGLSAILHGSRIVTFDLDICFSRSPANLKKLAVALAPFHPRPVGFAAELPFVWDERTLNNGTLFTLETDLGEIDLLGEVAGVGTYADVKAHSVTTEAYDRRIEIIDLPSLIAAKLAAGREKDIAAVKELETLLEAQEPGPE